MVVRRQCCRPRVGAWRKRTGASGHPYLPGEGVLLPSWIAAAAVQPGRWTLPGRYATYWPATHHHVRQQPPLVAVASAVQTFRRRISVNFSHGQCQGDRAVSTAGSMDCMRGWSGDGSLAYAADKTASTAEHMGGGGCSTNHHDRIRLELILLIRSHQTNRSADHFHCTHRVDIDGVPACQRARGGVTRRQPAFACLGKHGNS